MGYKENAVRKWKKWAIAGVLAILFLALLQVRFVRYPYVQEYTVGAENIKGEVDADRFAEINAAFAIGANENGYAVFKTPNRAFWVLQQQYGKGIRAIQREFWLLPLTQLNYKAYMTYGSQTTKGTAEEIKQAGFVSAFFDIYENSF